MGHPYTQKSTQNRISGCRREFDFKTNKQRAQKARWISERFFNLGLSEYCMLFSSNVFSGIYVVLSTSLSGFLKRQRVSCSADQGTYALASDSNNKVGLPLPLGIT